MRRVVLFFVMVLIVGYVVHGQSELLTVAEQSNYKSTSTYEDVMSFISVLTESSAFIRVDTIAKYVSRLKENTVLQVEKFKIQELKGFGRLNQGHYTNSINGKYVMEEKEFASGTYIITTKQKLGSLIASLLEPQADDGLLKWNYFDRYLVPQWGGG